MRRTLALLTLLAPPSCTGESADVADDGGLLPGEDAATDDTTDGAATDSTGEGGEPIALAPLKGAVVTALELNAGVAQPLYTGAPLTLEPPLPRHRPARLRAAVDLPAGSTGTRVHATAVFSGPDGERATAVSEVVPSTTAVEVDFELAADVAVPGLGVQLEFRRESDAHLPGAGSVFPRPLEQLPIAVTHAMMRMRVVVVPVDYRGTECQALTDTSAATLERLETALFERNPVSEVELAVHEPILYDGDLTTPGGVSGLKAQTMMLRTADEPDPEVYYYGLFDNCRFCITFGGGPGEPCYVGGAAGLPSDAPSDAFLRVAVGQFEPPDRTTEWTFTHELGHLQGRSHVFCPTQDAGGTDGQYPHEDGLIGAAGYGVLTGEDYDPAATHDYMSYCQDTWVSDYSWAATAQRIATLSAYGG